MQSHISAALFLTISVASLCGAILAGELASNNNSSKAGDGSQQATPTASSERPANNNNLTVSSENAITKLDSNSTFYYEADTFLLNGKGLAETKPKTTTSTPTSSVDKETTRAQPAASHQAISGRNGRMLDLDELVGDLDTSRANKERRAQLTNRQSRNLPSSHHLDIGNGKRLHIQGFIPIVGIKDDDQNGDEPSSVDKTHGNEHQLDQLQSAASALRPYQQQNQQARLKMMMPSHNQMDQSGLELPYAQSSIGHATFNVQRYLNTDNQQQQSPLNENNFNQFQHHTAAPQPPARYTPAGIVETLKKPIQKLTNTFGGSNNNDQQQHQKLVQLQQQQQQQQNCLCVPFYMCKNGYISESGLGRSQIQQMISQQQQQQASGQMTSVQQPRQPLAETQQLATRPQQGLVESASLGGASFANSFVPVDERSSERELVTVPTTTSQLANGSPEVPSMVIMNNLDDSKQETSSGLDSQQGQSQASSDNGQQKPSDQQTPSADSSSADSALSSSSSTPSNSSANAISSPDEMTTLNQSSDYSQDILGRMLGLKANSRVSMLGSASQTSPTNQQQQSSTGVCGLLRTCCNIPISLYPTQQQQLQPQETQQQVVALQRYQQPALLQAPLAAAASQVSRVQISQPGPASGYDMSSTGLQPASLYHRTSSDYSTQQQLQQQQRPQPMTSMMGMPSTSVQQYARAPIGKQALQSFQAPLVSPVAYPNVQQLQQHQPKPNFQMANNNHHHQNNQNINHHYQSNAIVRGSPHGQLGTRKLLEGRCGLRQSAGINGRVQNLASSENSADFGEYPAQAAILKRLNGSESLFVCSGTLISQSWVATAAHCIRKHLNQGQLRVRLGEWDVHRDDEFYPYVEKDVRDLIIHPEFVPGNLINDIALVRLDSPVDPTLPHVNPACLPAPDESFARQRCWVAGWGKDAFGQQGSFQSVLQEVELPVLGHAECESSLRQTRLGPHYRLHPGFTCAGGEPGKDACEGDGGSGLYCTQEGVIKVAGLVSWGISCGQKNVPGVFVSMPHYRNWIESIISIDDDIYSPYNILPANTLISERNSAGANNSTATNGQEAPDNSGRSAEGASTNDKPGGGEISTPSKSTTSSS